MDENSPTIILMGLYQDQTDQLSELRRLAALVSDPIRIHEIGADQWPLAMIAYGLTTCNDETRLEESVRVYQQFLKHVPSTARLRCLSQLSQFITQRKGDGWRALLCFALADPEASLRRHAAFLICTLARPSTSHKFLGIISLVESIIKKETTEESTLPSKSALLDTLLSLSDLRPLPLLRKIIDNCSSSQLNTLINNLDCPPNALSCEWLLQCLEAHPELATNIAQTLIFMAPKSEEIIDLILPIPTWEFKQAAPQHLHGWTIAEFFPRMETRLTPHMDSAQLIAIETAWKAKA